MDFKEFLPENTKERIASSEEIASSESEDSEASINDEKIGQNQFYDVITSKKPDWQSVIYELIHTEQLDPWDIDIVVLTQRYFEKIMELEDDPDFYVSSKILLAAALLLRIKSEFLLNKHIRSIDEILFGKKEESKPVMERIEIDEDELPLLIPKTPMSRLRRVTLPELMTALNKAIGTESRRIKREVRLKRARKLAEVDFPTFKRIDLKDRIRQFYARILTALKKKAVRPEKHLNKISYSELIGKEKEERLACFLPLLHLDNSKKVWTEQEKHLEEIWVYLYEYFDKNKNEFVENLAEDIEEMRKELEQEAENREGAEGENIDEVKSERKNNLIQRLQEKRRLKEEVAKEIAEEISEINKEKKIDEISGFGSE